MKIRILNNESLIICDCVSFALLKYLYSPVGKIISELGAGLPGVIQFLDSLMT